VNKFQRFVLRFGSSVASIAMLVGVLSIKPTCVLWFHQPKVPQGMKEFKK